MQDRVSLEKELSDLGIAGPAYESPTEKKSRMAKMHIYKKYRPTQLAVIYKHYLRPSDKGKVDKEVEKRFNEIDKKFQRTYGGLKIDEISIEDTKETIRRNVVRQFLMNGTIHPKSVASTLDDVNTSLSYIKKSFQNNFNRQKEGINTFADGISIISETRPDIPPPTSFSDVLVEHLQKGLLKKSGDILKSTQI